MGAETRRRTVRDPAPWSPLAPTGPHQPPLALLIRLQFKSLDSPFKCLEPMHSIIYNLIAEASIKLEKHTLNL